MKHVLPVRLSILLLFGSALPAGLLADSTIDFGRDVRPVLADLCFECHGPDEESRVTEMRLDGTLALPHLESGRPAIVPGRPLESPLYLRLIAEDEDERMPPAESPRQPDRSQIETLRKWIEQGAPMEEHWAFVPPRRPSLPDVERQDWPRNPLDRFVLAGLEERGLAPRPDAPPGVLARRLSLALTGLPLEPAAIDAFVEAHAADPDGAIDRLVDSLLTSPAHAEHRAWTWLDAARYADTNGYQGDGVREMWPWRDWLIRTLASGMPLDRMTHRMLAGDLLMPPRLRDWETARWIPDATASELLLATGFLRNHRYDTGSGTIPAESIFENATDRMETVATVWMGLTLRCARCHTHKFDPIDHREYYRLLSFFDNVPEVGSALKMASHPYVHVPPEPLRNRLLDLDRRRESLRAELENLQGELAAARERWEKEIASSAEPAPIRVRRGLRHRYAEKTLEFDGETSIRKSRDPVALCAGNRTWSISFWFRPDGEDDGAIFSSVEEPERYRPGIQTDWVDGRVRVRHVCRWVNSYIEFESATRLDPGRWYHVTFRCDGRMQGLAYRASLDGDDAAMLLTHPVTNDSAGKAGKAPLVLGGSPLMPGFRGALRDLRFYDRFLDPERVSSLAEPRDTARLARLPRDQRGPEIERILELAFLESEALPPRVKTLREELHAVGEEFEKTLPKAPTAMVMQECDLGPTRVRQGGAYDREAEPVMPDTPAFLPPLGAAGRSRVELARWLTSPDHPLTARVAVNRIWQLLWGRGLVASPENFGIQCPEPLQVELLDWLATEVHHREWDLRTLIRTIVTSRAYRQDSAAPAELWRRDPENRWLGRGPRFRLPVHVVRDQALSLSGRLDTTVGGPPVMLERPRDASERPRQSPFAASSRRRTIYSFWKRNAPHPLLAVFDVADRNECEVRVQRTNTPLQALVTLNEPGLVACARDFARRIRERPGTDRERLTWAWKACTGRDPAVAELDLLRARLERYRTLAREEAGAGDGASSSDSAWLALAGVLLNLDSTLTLE